jgi:hypothetical protein
MEEEGARIANLIFRKGTSKGGSTLIKPNMTFIPDEVWDPAVGVITLAGFLSGFRDSCRALWEMGNTNVSCPSVAAAAGRTEGRASMTFSTGRTSPHSGELFQLRILPQKRAQLAQGARKGSCGLEEHTDIPSIGDKTISSSACRSSRPTIWG